MKQYTVKDLLASLYPRVMQHKLRFFLGTFVRVTSDISALMIPLGISWILTFAANYVMGGSLDMLWLVIGGLALLQIYRYISVNLSKVLLYTLGENLCVEAQEQGLKHAMRLDLLWHEKENTGNKLKKIHRAGDGINRMLRLYEGIFIEGVINIFVISAIFFQLRWELTAMVLFFAVSYFFLARISTKRIAARVRVVNKAEEQFEGLKFETLNSIHTVKSLGLYASLSAYLAEHAKSLKSAIKQRIITVRKSWTFMGSYQGIFQCFLLGYTTFMVLQGNLEVGTIALVLFYFGMMEAAASEFADLYQEIVVAKLSIAQLDEILEETPVTEDGGTSDFPKNWQELRVDNLHFSLGDKKILQGLTFKIHRGEKVGIVGISGAGKSTLMKLLLKLYKGYEGAITFDGQELADIRRESYIAQVATVPQDTEVFHFSLKENIMLGEAATTESTARLKKAMRIAHVDEFVKRLPEGERTMIGEKGVKLSGGERQRLGIARAVYRDPDILLLDEATSHLDVTSEQKIQDALHTFFSGVTAIVIAHRLSTLKEMDRILVIQNGRLAEEGNFDALLAQKGVFWDLWEKQAL